MIEFRIANQNDLSLMISSRLEMMRIVNNLPENFCFNSLLVNQTKEAFFAIEQDTVLALEDEKVVGCATACYHTILPTFTNVTGKRAYILNVYTH